MANNFAPLVSVKPTSIEISEKKSFLSLIDVMDLDNNPILTYRFRDNGSLATSGFFIRNGVKVAANQWIEVSAADIGSIVYQAGLVADQETISVQVYDGRWSSIASGAITSINQNFFAPEVSTVSGSILANEIRLVSDLVSATDRDGNAIQRFEFLDPQAHPNSGYFTYDGVRVTSGLWFSVLPENLQRLRFVSAVYGPFTETLSVRATDGKFMSSIESFSITTTRNSFAPVLNAVNVQAATGVNATVRPFFTVSDADGNTIKSISFRDSGVSAGSGYFTVNGVPQQQGVFFTVPYSQLETVRYQYANQSEVEFFSMQVSDGTYISQVVTGTIKAVPRPALDVTSTELVFDALETTQLSALFSKGDNGPNYTKYEVYDRNNDITSARIVVNGNALLQDKVYELSPGQMANTQIRAAMSDRGRSLDEIYVRANNGLFWTDWERLNVNTEPVANRALQSFGRWDNQTDGKTIVTYQFAESVVPYYAPDSSEVTSFQALTPEAREAIRAIYLDIEKYANVRFIELPWQPNPGAAKTVWGMNTQTGSQAYAYGPISETGTFDPVGDIWVSDAGPTAPDHPDRGVRGSYAWLTYYHEIGHSMGFKHPFEGDPVLPSWLDDSQVTIMSYTDSRRAPADGANNRGYATTFTVYDIVELQRLYGANMAFNSGDTQYRWDLNDNNLQSVWDGNGNDTINFGNQVAAATIDLREGHYSSLNGRANALIVPFGAKLENARGTRNNDTIFGNEMVNLIFAGEGNDRISGFGGNDIIRGGSGSDTYTWSMGDGRDVIREDSQGGLDVIEFRDLIGNYDALQNDFTFWRTGTGLKDLRIELTLDSKQSLGGMTITDMNNGSSQVETLRIVDKNGALIGRQIDLNSVYTGSSDEKKQFRITDFQTPNGYVAVPI
ncbi:MAG: M10 family metallopeptidase [Pirellulaceae bacterium]